MHDFLPLERLAPDTRGDYHAQVSGKSGSTQPYSPALKGSDPAQSGGYRSRLGCRTESPPCGRETSVSGFGSRNSRGLANFSARDFVRAVSAVTSWVLLALIRAYQFLISPVLPSSCRFVPTCSAYAYEAIERWGVCRGTWYALRRLVRCHPFGGHGYDPVP
jgi:uncharacterized protein